MREPTGELTSLGLVDETVILDPATGGQLFIETQEIIRADDGSLLIPPLYSSCACNGCGKRRLAGDAGTACHRCGHATCNLCARLQEENGEILTLCAPCAAPPSLMRRLLAWLVSVK